MAQMVTSQIMYARRLGAEFEPPWIRTKYLYLNLVYILFLVDEGVGDLARRPGHHHRDGGLQVGVVHCQGL